MKFICPLITVSDMEASKKFYTEFLGQKIQFDFGENVSFEGGFSIHLDRHFRQLIDQKPLVQGGNNFELYFEENELDSLAEKLDRKKISLVHALREQPWHQRVIRFYDPDRHIIEVGESMEHTCQRLAKEGHSTAEISAMTTMPEEYVKNAISN
ncbi:MAG TPA: VOC family protein [Prolixibacteraceae bacterium]|nr:VOC family protein [Prolixibacteraceae bacterium]